jgi:predicted nucleic acid-binding protein
MRVVDTSAWIEWLAGSRLAETVDTALPPSGEWLVPTIVQMELAKWVRREFPAEKAEQLIAFTTTCVIADLTTDIAIFAAEICARHKLATADAIIYATALTYEADLLTCDRHFENLPGVCYLAKSAA